MKKLLPLTLGLALLLSLAITSQGAARGASPQDLQARVDELTEALAQQARVTKEIEVRFEEILDYLARQAEAAKKLESTLDQAEEQGFTSGINFESRRTLLNGWRAALDEVQKGVPSAAKAKEKGETQRVPRRPARRDG